MCGFPSLFVSLHRWSFKYTSQKDANSVIFESKIVKLKSFNNIASREEIILMTSPTFTMTVEYRRVWTINISLDIHVLFVLPWHSHILVESNILKYCWVNFRFPLTDIGSRNETSSWRISECLIVLGKSTFPAHFTGRCTVSGIREFDW